MLSSCSVFSVVIVPPLFGPCRIQDALNGFVHLVPVAGLIVEVVDERGKRQAFARFARVFQPCRSGTDGVALELSLCLCLFLGFAAIQDENHLFAG